MIILPNSKWTIENTKIVEDCIQSSSSVKVNPSLIFNKYLFWEKYSGTPTLDKKNIKKNKEYYDKNFCKIKQFKRVIDIKIPLALDQYMHLKKRKNSLPQIDFINLTTRTRLIVNHGGESILENSIALHPYYGFPIIPGSAIKGVTRHFCEEFKHLDDGLIKKIFGNSPGEKESEEGNIIFLDAWPMRIDNKFLEIDVFTPHYQDYYQGEKLPRDDQNPVPVNFLAVKKGVIFEFAIAPSSRCKNEDIKYLINETKKIISETLKTFGIGAKTGSNYGYFEQGNVV